MSSHSFADALLILPEWFMGSELPTLKVYVFPVFGTDMSTAAMVRVPPRFEANQTKWVRLAPLPWSVPMSLSGRPSGSVPRVLW